MKRIAIVLIVILLALLCLTGYLLFTCEVRVGPARVEATEAATQQAAFDQYARQLPDGEVPGTLFRREALGDSADYQFLTYHLPVINTTFINAAAVEAQVTPQDADVLQAYAKPVDVPARGEGEVSVTLLTRADAHSVREITVTYWLWGLPFTARVTAGR